MKKRGRKPMKILVKQAVVGAGVFFLQFVAIDRAEALLTRNTTTCFNGGFCLNYAPSGATSIGGNDGGIIGVDYVITALDFALLPAVPENPSLGPSLGMNVTGSTEVDGPFYENYDFGPFAYLASTSGAITLDGLGTLEQLRDMITTSSAGLAYEPLPNPQGDIFGTLYDASTFVHLTANPAAAPPPVPEPSTFLLVGAGAAGLAALQFRRRRSS